MNQELRHEEFLEEIEKRLEENRRLATKSWIPGFLKPLVTYLGFNTVRSLVVVSLIATILVTVFNFEQMVNVGKIIFLY